MAFQGFVERLHAHLATRGFPSPGTADGYLVRALAEAPQRQRELARRLGITEQGAGKIVADMEQRGLVERRVDPDDPPAWQVSVAPRGRELLRLARAFHRRFERDLAGRLGADVAATRRVLEHVVAHSADDTSQGRLRAT